MSLDNTVTDASGPYRLNKYQHTAADGGTAVLRGSVVLSQVGDSAAPAAELRSLDR
jgi:hypothetical protein